MSEVKRKIFRMTTLVFPALYFFLPKAAALYFIGAISLIFLFLEILRFYFPLLTKRYFAVFPWLAKERERFRISSISWLVWGSFLTVLFFERKIAIIALFFLILGDTAAALVRRKTQRLKAFGRGLEGTGALLAICLIVGFIFSKIWQIPIMITAVGAVSAGLAELVPIKIKDFYLDDNFSIALVSGLVMSLMG